MISDTPGEKEPGAPCRAPICCPALSSMYLPIQVSHGAGLTWMTCGMSNTSPDRAAIAPAVCRMTAPDQGDHRQVQAGGEHAAQHAGISEGRTQVLGRHACWPAQKAATAISSQRP